MCRRAGFVKHLFLRSEFRREQEHVQFGVTHKTTREIFEELSSHFLNLRSVPIDGEVSQEIWDVLLDLLSLKELRLWRVYPLGDETLNFSGLLKLQAFELSELFEEEAVAFAVAVRESHIERLHVTVPQI